LWNSNPLSEKQKVTTHANHEIKKQPQYEDNPRYTATIDTNADGPSFASQLQLHSSIELTAPEQLLF
jgi:hypothetical protein